MCGVLGFIANRNNGFHQPEVKAVHDMLYVSALRGMDSTGVFYVTNSGDVQTHKEVGESAKFLKTKEWEATDKELFKNGQAIVGHCRASTRGARTDENAHPFIVDNKIVLVHNGTINGSHDHLAKTAVDSHAIAHVLAEEPDVATALSRINGAYALIWYNTETRYLYAVRNKERQLFFAKLQDGSMMFASEMSFIYTAAWRNGLKIADDWPKLLDEHTLFSCNLDDINEDYKWEELDCAYKVPVKETFRRPESTTGLPKNVMALAAPAGYRQRDTNGLPTLVEIAEEMGYAEWDGAHNWRSFAKANQCVILEAEEYQHINGDLYYVYGKIASVNMQLNDFAVGWEITCPSEEEVVQYLTKQYFEGKVEFGVGRGIRLRGEDKETALFKLYDVEPLNTADVQTLEMQ